MPVNLLSRLLLLGILLLVCLYPSSPSAAAAGGHPLAGDALKPPIRIDSTNSRDARPSPDQPSAFFGGRVVVQIIFLESDGSAEPSTENWTPELIASIESHIGEALDWWRNSLPAARLSFELKSVTAPTRYEPITHDLSGEGMWISDALSHLGYSGIGYFDQAYTADDALRQASNADWATTLFMVNSTNDADGRFADTMFAYAYVGGPFMVLTSDVGLYGTRQMAPVAAHELGHIFGALDQYSAASVLCTQSSGYLWIPSTNSQYNNCGSHLPSIMLDPVAAFPGGKIDESALGQVGYRDSDGDGLPDPLDTNPTLDLAFEQAGGGRPVVHGQINDQPFPSISTQPTTINTLVRAEYRVDGGAWWALPAQDGAYDGAVEDISMTLPLYDGQHSVDIRALNSVDAASPLFSRTITVTGVGSAPAYALEAPRFSNSAAITLTLEGPAGSMAQISEDPLYSGANWTPITAISGWQLSSVDGTHTLYVRFRDSAGVESPPLSRVIVLDRMAPSGIALVHGKERPWVELQAHDSGSGVAAVQISTDAKMEDWRSFQQTLPLPSGAQHVMVRFRDAAGNVSAPVQAQNADRVFLPLINRP
jgi:hypothetical protein